MAHFQKNLLEAFQDADDERAGGAPASAGPFAGPPPDAPLEPPPGALPPTPPRGHLLPALSPRDARVVLAFAGVAILAFVLGLAAGRGLGSPAEAAGPGAAGGAETTAGLELSADAGRSGDAARSGLAPGEPVNAALRDSAHEYTVLAVTYGASELEVDLAYATYHHFAAAGLPVAYPVKLAGYLYVLVGAAPTRADLLPLRDRIRGLADPDGRPSEYAEAYVIGIDSVFSR